MDQNWEPIVLKKKKTPAQTGAASRAQPGQVGPNGVVVETVKKHNAGQNHHLVIGSAKKLEEETVDFHHQKVPLELRKAIQQARQAKSMTQKDLAVRLNEKASVVNDYESGKAIPNNGMIARMEKILETKLPRPPKPKKVKEDE
eukprot:c15494_g1_i1.p1 GENE.c15494_g1_i1~~c15494_g1_i1.p1  ORF type:complete len:144 (-),score=65.60 c15494_g1_i1:47-478(-)